MREPRETYEQSRNKFNSYAGIDSPDLPEDSLSALQVQLYRWQNNNFGLSSDVQIACGIAEEVGEFIEAWSGDDTDQLEDAVGDVLIYATQLATSNRLDFGTIFNFADELSGPMVQQLSVVAGKLCHIALKSSQDIRGFADAEFRRKAVSEQLYLLVCAFHKSFGHNELEYIYRRTAQLVLLRDWTTNKASGLVEVKNAE